MKLLKLLSLFLLAFNFLQLEAQSAKLTVTGSEFSENIFSAGKYGILKYNETKITIEYKKYIELTFKQYDTTLDNIRTKSVLIPERLGSYKSYYSQSDQTLYFFAADFFRSDWPRNKGRIVSYDMKDGSLSNVKCTLHSGFWLKDIHVCGGNVLVSEQFKNKQFVVINSNTCKSKKIKISDLKEDVSYVFLEDLSAKSGYVVYNKILPDGKQGVMFYNYAHPELSLSLNSSKSKKLESFYGMQSESGSLILTGAYSLTEGKSKKGNKNTTTTIYVDRNDGVYFANFTKDQKPVIKYFPILEDAFDKGEPVSSGRNEDEVEYELNFRTHEPVKSGNNYLILVDFVYNKYGLVGSHSSTVNGKTTAETYMGVVGQVPYYSVLMRVSEEGEMIRKDTFNINPVPVGSMTSWMKNSNFSFVEGAESDGVFKIFYLTSDGLCCKLITEKGLETMPLVWPKKKPLDDSKNLIYLFQKNCAIGTLGETQIILRPVKYK